MQSVSALLPGPEYVLGAQATHADTEVAAGAALYFPREHSVHAAEPLTDL